MEIKMWRVFKILNIYKKIENLRVPASVAYKFNKLCIALENDANFCNSEVNKILQQYGDRNEDGSIKTNEHGGVLIKEEELAAAQEEINNLDNLDVEAPDIYFTVEELDKLDLSIADFNFMLPFVKED